MIEQRDNGESQAAPVVWQQVMQPPLAQKSAFRPFVRCVRCTCEEEGDHRLGGRSAVMILPRLRL